jgi:hypothetical protein
VAKILSANKLKGSHHGGGRSSGPSAADKAKREAEATAIQCAITDATLKASADLDAAGKKPLPMTFWRRLARTELTVHKYELEATVFKGRGLSHSGDSETNWATLNAYVDRQVTPHNLIGLIVQVLLEATVSAYETSPLTIWGTDWKQFLPKPAAPIKAKAKTQKPTKIKTKKGKKK